MKCKTRLAIVILISFLALPLMGQVGKEPVSKQEKCIVDMDAWDDDQIRFQAIRILEDPTTHQEWLLARDLKRPVAPARLMPLPGNPICKVFGPEHRHVLMFTKPRVASVPVIRAGDSLIVSEHTSISDARLEAIALRAAGSGEAMTVRLKIGGRVLRAIAVAPGQASLLGGTSQTHP